MQDLLEAEALSGRWRLTPAKLPELALKGGALALGWKGHLGIVREEPFPLARKLVDPRLDAAE